MMILNANFRNKIEVLKSSVDLLYNLSTLILLSNDSAYQWTSDCQIFSHLENYPDKISEADLKNLIAVIASPGSPTVCRLVNQSQRKMLSIVLEDTPFNEKGFTAYWNRNKDNNEIIELDELVCRQIICPETLLQFCNLFAFWVNADTTIDALKIKLTEYM